MKLVTGLWRAVSELVSGLGRAYTEQRGRKQGLREMARTAQLQGATDGKRFGPAVVFYRPNGDRVECCFAEYSSSTQSYGWIWEPPDWHDSPHGYPAGTTPIAEIARRGI